MGDVAGIGPEVIEAGVEVLVAAEDLFDDLPPLLGHPPAPALQELLKPFLRRERDFNLFELKGSRQGSRH